jgi:Flp pilus assembly pilin Flp
MPSRQHTRETGQGLIEYALLLILAALAAVLALSGLGVSLQSVYAQVVAALGGQSCDVYYQSAFDKGMNEWSPISGSGLWKGGWRIVGGKMVGEPLSAATLKSFNQSDVAVTADGVTLENVRTTWQGFGIIWRASVDKGNLSGYMFEVEKKDSKDPGLMYFSKWVKGNQVVPPLASAPPPPGFDWTRIGQMRVVMQGDTMTAYLNGVRVLQARDRTYTSGSAGMAANYGSRATVGAFSVQAPDCP